MEMLVIEKMADGTLALVVFSIPRESYDSELKMLWVNETACIESGTITAFTILAVDDGMRDPAIPVNILDQGIQP